MLGSGWIGSGWVNQCAEEVITNGWVGCGGIFNVSWAKFINRLLDGSDV